jgi:hypothetical protein
VAQKVEETHWLAEKLGLEEAYCVALPVALMVAEANSLAEGLGVCSSAPLGEGVTLGVGEADAHSEAVAVGQREAEAHWVGEALCDCCAPLGEGGALAVAQTVAEAQEEAEALAKLALAEAQGLGKGLCVTLAVRLWLTVPLRVLDWLSEGDCVLLGQPELKGEGVSDPLIDVVCCGSARGRDSSKMVAVSNEGMAALPPSTVK